MLFEKFKIKKNRFWKKYTTIALYAELTNGTFN